MRKFILIAIVFLALLTGNAQAWFTDFTANNIKAGTLLPTKDTNTVLSTDATKIQGVILRPTLTIGNCYVGPCDRLTRVDGFLLSSDCVVALPINQLNKICVQCDTTGKGVSWLAIYP
jgi:hypothetical protein